MKKLTLKEAIRLSQILKTADIDDEVHAVISAYNIPKEDPDREKETGVAFLRLVCSLLGDEKNEQKLYELLAGPFEMDPGDVERITLTELPEMLKQLVKENDFESFFDSVSKMTNASFLI